MLAIRPPTAGSAKCTPNLLPCRIDHDGPVNAADRYWKPEAEKDGSPTAYFRGRKLRGREIELPHGYRGAVLRNTTRTLPQGDADPNEEAEEDDEQQRVEVRVMEEMGDFDRMVVWGHEAAPDETEDPYSKGVKEWIAFAEAMHSCPEQDAATTTSKS